MAPSWRQGPLDNGVRTRPVTEASARILHRRYVGAFMMLENEGMSFEGVHPDFFTEIGKITVLQSEIEGCLRIVITNLTGMDERTSNAVTKPLSFKYLIAITKSLLVLRAKQIPEQHITYTTDAMQRAIAAEVRRNTYVHSMWGFGPDVDPAHASRLKLSGKPPELKVYMVSIDDARALRLEMQEIGDSLMYVHPYLNTPRTDVPPGGDNP